MMVQVGARMNVVDIVEFALRASARASDRKLMLQLYVLATKLHDLFIPPDEATQILQSMADGTIKRTELEQVHHRIVSNEPEINRVVRELATLAKTNGRELFNPTELHLLEALIDKKRVVRVAIVDLFVRYRNTKFAKQYPYAQQTADELRYWGLENVTPVEIERMKSDETVVEDAKKLLIQIENLNFLLDKVFASLTETAPRVEASAAKKGRMGFGQVLFAMFVGAVFWTVGAATAHFFEPFIGQIVDETKGLLSSVVWPLLEIEG